MCSVTGSHMHSVGLDETHEMLINIDLKTSIVRPTKEYLDRMLFYYPVRSLVTMAVKNAVLLDTNDSNNNVRVLDSSPKSMKEEENVNSVISKIDDTNTLEVVNESKSLTSMSGQVARVEQQKDLGGFNEFGREWLENQIKFFILKDPSAQVPRRKARLLTFTSTKKQQKKKN